MTSLSNILNASYSYIEDVTGISIRRREIDEKFLRLFVLIFISYVLTGYGGLHLQSVNTYATLIWPPSGIAFAAFLFYGARVWPGVFFGAFVVQALAGAPLPIAIFIAFGNTLGPLVGTALAKWYSNYNFEVLRLRDNVGIIGSAFIVPVITATIGVGSLWLGNALPLHSFSETWGTWWLGDALGTIVCAPFILKWVSRPIFSRSPAEYLELIFACFSVVLTTFLIFWLSLTPFTYAVFIPMMWVALRTGARGNTLALLLLSIISIGGTLLGHGPFSGYGLWHLQVYLITVCALFHFFTAVVAERKRIVATLEQHVNELEIALNRISSEDEAKKEFLAILAHELRNPLATILGSVELIHLQGIPAKNTPMLVDTIADRARAMVHLLDDLLDISRISQKKLTLQKQRVSVSAFVDKLIQTTEPLVAKYDHTFSIVRPEEDLYVDADPIRLEQIFTNLVINASKYTKSPGSITVSIKRDGDMVAARIKDTGIGIPKNMLRRIFEPFFQVKRSESNREGMGIGLPLTRQLVEMHGGTIEAYSEGAGTGSEFIVRLPLAAQSLEQANPGGNFPAKGERRKTPRQVKNPFRILVVDDNAEALEALEQLFTLRGHTVAVAPNGIEGVKKAAEFKPQVAFLDIGMPDIDGYEVARRLRATKKPYYLVALTGYGQPEDIKAAKEAGFDYHLTKPASFVDIENVLRRIRRSIDTKGYARSR